MGSDNGYQGGGTYGNPFQSTLPGWGATDSCAHVTVFNTANFNPRSPDGERLGDGAAMAYRADISIHAPRMGSDTALPVSFATFWRFQSTLPGWGATVQHRLTGFILKISIHAPRMGSDCLRLHNCSCHMKFQSTLPGWGATVCSRRIGCRCRDFNPRSPDGERLSCAPSMCVTSYISIHAPRMGSDFVHGWRK